MIFLKIHNNNMITEQTLDPIYDGTSIVHITKIYMNGILYKEEYVTENYKKCNIVHYKKDGITVDFKVWMLNGKLGRDEDLPAAEHYFDNKNIKSLAWYQNGEQHRDGDLPAAIWYDFDGTICTQFWYKNDKIHRDNHLPALIEYYKDGKTVIHKAYYKNDVEYKCIDYYSVDVWVPRFMNIINTINNDYIH